MHDPSKVTVGLGPFLLSRASADVLARGKIGSDELIHVDGARYQVLALAEEGRMIARAVAV